MSLRPFRILAAFLFLSLACIAQTTFPTNPTRFIVCDNGDGHFEGKLPDGVANPGVSVFVGATKQANGFAAHACVAKLTWGHHDLIVTPEAAQADIDVMGADFGLGSLVVAFQIKASATDPHIRYEIYSLAKPPRLLRVITGEDFFSAADTMLDGSVEIWTTDAEAVDGFEGFPRTAFDTPPTVVLRFEKKKLIDVSSEFRPWFDHQIENLRTQLTAQQIAAFRQSDGRLSDEHVQQTEPPVGLLATKIKVLEIVWAYLYSGREQKAWDALADMWPVSDLGRIRAAVTAAQSRGLRTQVDDVSHTALPFRQTHSAEIYEGIGAGQLGPNDPSRNSGVRYSPNAHAEHADTSPVQILLKIPPPPDGGHWGEGKLFELVIDEAGKVRSARIMTPLFDKRAVPQLSQLDQDWLTAASGWKYIPAYNLGHPRAFRQTLFVNRDQ